MAMIEQVYSCKQDLKTMPGMIQMTDGNSLGYEIKQEAY